MTEAQKAHQHFLVKVREESEQATLYNLQQRKLPEGNSCKYWHVPDVQNTNLQVGPNSETDLHTNKQTAKSADEKRNSASIAIHIAANGERQMRVQRIQSDDKTQVRVILHHLENK